MIVIIDYGMGNLGSIQNMLKKVGAEVVISCKPTVIASADKLILPGVGSFDNGMSKLKALGLLTVLHQKVVDDKIPILGICLGMQLMTKSSEEGLEKGLGWINADTVRFTFSSNVYRVPHMGWNTTQAVRQSKLMSGLGNELRFYFAHSYHVMCHDDADILARTTYAHEFTSAIEHENIAGVQFHPEKSHKYGMQLLKHYAFRF